MQPDLLGAAPVEPHRLFFALFPEPVLRARIADAAAEVERSRPSGGRLLKPERYHLTLRFLGNFEPLPPSLVAIARAAGDAVCMQAFDWALDHAGSFAGNGVRWLGGARSEALHGLWKDLGDALARNGVRAPRVTFAPHLTIARDARCPLEPVTIDSLCWPVRGFALVDSRPGRPYEVLQYWEAA